MEINRFMPETESFDMEMESDPSGDAYENLQTIQLYRIDKRLGNLIDVQGLQPRQAFDRVIAEQTTLRKLLDKLYTGSFPRSSSKQEIH